MLDIQTHQLHHGQDALHESAFCFTGAFDDNSFCRGPQCLKPIATSFTKDACSTTKAFAPVTSPTSEVDTQEFAVLGDDDEYSEDELPRSPKRRHSGAISINSEDLPFCYDREALRRDTAAHRARHQQRVHSPTSSAPTGAFAVHESWDTELDGPHMAVWIPKSSAVGEVKRQRVNQSAQVASGSSRPRKNTQVQRPVSEIDGPMMALWGI